MWRYSLLLTVLLLQSGCTYNVRQTINNTIDRMADHPYDVAPTNTNSAKARSAKSSSLKTASKETRQSQETPSTQKVASDEKVATDFTANEWLESKPAQRDGLQFDDEEGVQTVAWMESQNDADAQPNDSDIRPVPQRNLDISIPPQLPGSEARRVELPKDVATQGRVINRIYPELPPLPVEPIVLSGPNGRAYTLSDLQQLAAANSPLLRQAVADVETARGSLIQAKTYTNPTVGAMFDPANNNSTANTMGVFVDQVVRTAGKQKLGVAASQKDLENAELALKRARSDLATAVRNAYFTLLVDVETLVVTRSLAKFTDEIYRMHTGLLKGAIAAPYEPASLRAQAFTTRLAYKQAITSYIYDWKMLVATIGEHQLPLTEVAGQVDRLIPYYEYDQVLAYALQNHTDILSARNVVKKAQYNLKLAQVTAIPDVDVRLALEKDTALLPFGTYQTLTVGGPLAIWDQNKGNIIAAQGGLARATEESHRVEVALTNALANAYTNYQNNLLAIEDYRRYILPDLVRYYRGIHARRQVDPNSAFGDLVAAQQNLSTNVMSYLVVLQNTWTSAVGVADFLQTDDLFQMAKPQQLPELPDFHRNWPCDHGTIGDGCEYRVNVNTPVAAVPASNAGSTEVVGVSRITAGDPVQRPSNRPANPRNRPPVLAMQSESDDFDKPGRRSPDGDSAAKVN